MEHYILQLTDTGYNIAAVSMKTFDLVAAVQVVKKSLEEELSQEDDEHFTKLQAQITDDGWLFTVWATSDVYYEVDMRKAPYYTTRERRAVDVLP